MNDVILQFDAFDLLEKIKPAAHVRKELSKVPGRALCSAVSSRVRRNFGRKFASRGREEKYPTFFIYFFLPRSLTSTKKDSKSHPGHQDTLQTN